MIEDLLERITKEQQEIWYEKTGSLTAIEIVRSCISIGYSLGKSEHLYTREDLMNAIRLAKNSMGVDNDGEHCYSNMPDENIIEWIKTYKND